MGTKKLQAYLATITIQISVQMQFTSACIPCEVLSFFMDKLPPCLSKHLLGKFLSKALYPNLSEILPFILRVSGTIGTFFFFSSAPSMVPAGKEKGGVFQTVSKVSNINLRRFEILIYFFLMKNKKMILLLMKIIE